MSDNIFTVEVFNFDKFLDAKRLIGRKFDDSSVRSDMKQWSFKVINDNNKPKIQVDYKV